MATPNSPDPTTPKPESLKKAKQAKLTERQLATILHALRMLQESEGGKPQICTEGKCEHFADVSEMDDNEIDELCESLNMDFEVEEEEDKDRYTNHYLCPNDSTRWDDNWSCMCNDRCPNCDAEIEPYASTDNRDQSETIHAPDVYQRANSVEGEGPKA
jgi:hypothetical protein